MARLTENVGLLWQHKSLPPEETDPSSEAKAAVQDKSREVSRAEGQELAKKHGCLFVETSAKANVAVQQAFEELVLKILETPNLLSSSSAPGMKLRADTKTKSSCC